MHYLMNGCPSAKLDESIAQEGAVNFGTIKDTTRQEKIRVKICGRSIWNYPSNKALTRDGWLQPCIMAKDSTLHEAVGLCHHWIRQTDPTYMVHFEGVKL